MTRYWGILVLILTLAGCGPRTDKLVITGSSTMAPVIAEVAERYEAETGVQVDVQSGGTGRGISDVRQGLADIGMASRALHPDEDDLTAFIVAQDGIALIVHRDNPVPALNDDQVRAIYQGGTDNWSAVGGGDRPITVVNKAEGRSTLELFLAYFQLDNRDVQADVVIGENQQGIKAVAGDPAAIGYVSVGSAEYEAEAGTPIRLLPLSGVAARIETVNAKRYPLRRELNLVVDGEPGDAGRAFIDFAHSAAVADLYRDHYFVPAQR